MKRTIATALSAGLLLFAGIAYAQAPMTPTQRADATYAAGMQALGQTATPQYAAAQTQEAATPAPPPGALGAAFIASLDLMKDTKDSAATHPFAAAWIAHDVAVAAQLHPRYLATSVAYDYAPYFARWATAIHAGGMAVWFRAHFNAWEGDEGVAATMTPAQYLAALDTFIRANPGDFAAGDILDPAPEPENAPYWAKTWGANWYAVPAARDAYNRFLIDSTRTADAALAAMGVTGVDATYHSTNGWIAANVLSDATAVAMGKVVSDSYVGQDPASTADQTVAAYQSELGSIHAAHPSVPVILGEWGYSTAGEVTDAAQQRHIAALIAAFKTLPWLTGSNYWVGPGYAINPDGTRLFNGSPGAWTLRPAANDLADWYNGGAASKPQPTATALPPSTATSSPPSSATASPTSPLSTATAILSSASPSPIPPTLAPTSTASPMPSATATSSPTTSTPSATAKPAPSGPGAPRAGIPNTDSGVHVGLTYTTGNWTYLANGKRDMTGYEYVYGARVGGATNMHADDSWSNTLGAAPWQEYYNAWSQDQNYDGLTPYHDLNWYKANHPDWVLYQADKTSPATYGFSQGHPTRIAIDYTNPAVQQYLYATFWVKAFAAGFDGLSFDDNTAYNLYSAVGCYCGTGGAWKARYSGNREDAAWKNAQAPAVQQIATLIHATYPTKTVTLENGWFPQWDTTAAVYQGANEKANMVEDEGGWFANGTGQRILAQPGKTSQNEWLDKMAYYQSLGKSGIGFYLINTVNGYNINTTNSTAGSQTRSDLQWAMGNYLLMKQSGAHDFMAMYYNDEASYGTPTKLFPEYAAASAIGAPTGDMAATGGLYRRDFTGGAALVNPDPAASHTVTLGAGYRDLYGAAQSTVTLAPGTATVLLKG